MSKIQGIKTIIVSYHYHTHSKNSQPNSQKLPQVSHNKICSGFAKNYIEVVHLELNPNKISYQTIVENFFQNHKLHQLISKAKTTKTLAININPSFFFTTYSKKKLHKKHYNNLAKKHTIKLFKRKFINIAKKIFKLQNGIIKIIGKTIKIFTQRVKQKLLPTKKCNKLCKNSTIKLYFAKIMSV